MSDKPKPSSRSSSKSLKKQPHEYSPKIAERRRALFPSNINNEQDDFNLADMTPIPDSCLEDSLSQNEDNNSASDTDKPSSDTRIRTVLFPSQAMTIPPQSFYKKESNSPPIIHKRNPGGVVDTSKLSPTPSKPFPRSNRRSKFGEINAGVKHKIRKPKKIELNKDMILKAAENIIDNSPLNSFLEQQKNTKANGSDDSILSEYMKTLNELNIIPSKIIMTDISPKDVIKQIQPAVSSTKSNDMNVTMSKKRSPSPLFESGEQNRKFFKSSRVKSLSNARELKPQLENGKLNKADSSKQGVEFELDPSDLDSQTNDLISSDKMDAILNVLDEKENIEQKNDVPSTVTNSQSITSEISPTNSGPGGLVNNSVSSIIAQNQHLLMSPTTQMCDMTSILAINSPKKARNLTYINGSTNNQESPSRASVMKKFRSISKNQMLLDAGQKKFGATQCPECKFVYHAGEPDDEIMHADYHTGTNVLRFSGWKNERVVQKCFEGGRIIQVVPSDPKSWQKKAKDLLEIINRELGYFDMTLNIENSQLYLYIKDRAIIGCLIAEPAFSARKMMCDQSGIDLCSEETYPIKCGVSRIWVSADHRKKQVATTLMNCLKRNFLHGYVLNDSDIAFSSPTELGKQFARKYFNTPNFLIYGV